MLSLIMIRDSDRWLGIDFRHLAALQAVTSEGSFHRAAERLGYTQSAVSQQIAALERIVGTQLVHRPGGPRPVSLTDAGEILVGHAEAILARLHAAEADVDAVAAGTAGCLRVGTYQSVGRCILPRVMAQFAACRPLVQIQLTESATDNELLPMVERGELDLTFSLLPMLDGPFEYVEVLRDPYVLMVPAGSPLARGAVESRDLDGLPLIGFRQCRSLEPLEGYLRGHGIEPRYVFRSDDNGTVQAMVAAGVGVALVPRLTVQPSDERIAVIDLPDPSPPRVIVLAWHRDRYRSPAMTTFIDAVRGICADPGGRAQIPRSSVVATS